MTDTFYKPIETDFNKNGFRFRQIRRDGDIAIFHKEAMANRHPLPFDGGFEVVVITRHEQYQLGDAIIEAGESYPSPEQWGYRGWSYNYLNLAFKKYESLLNKPIESMGEDVSPAPEEDEVVEIKSELTSSKSSELFLQFPSGQFTAKELAEYNHMDYNSASVFIRHELEKSITKSGQRPQPEGKRGKPSTLYTKI